MLIKLTDFALKCLKVPLAVCTYNVLLLAKFCDHVLAKSAYSLLAVLHPSQHAACIHELGTLPSHSLPTPKHCHHPGGGHSKDSPTILNDVTASHLSLAFFPRDKHDKRYTFYHVFLG